MEEVRCRVRCSGRMHTVTLTESGALVLHDHPDLITERALVALGGKLPRCLAILEAWKQKDRATLPPVLHPALNEAQKKTKERVMRNTFTDPLSVSFRTRAEERVKKIAEDLLQKCAYRRSQSRWAGGNHIACARVGEPHICGGSEQVRSENGKWTGTNSYVSATVPISWFTRVYRRGLAVVDGWFVLDVLTEDEKGFTVLAGRQGRGFEVNLWPAVITRSADGDWHLRWVSRGNSIVTVKKEGE